MRNHTRMLSVGWLVVAVGVSGVLVATLLGGVTGAQLQPAQIKPPTIDGKIAPGEYKFSYTDPDLKMEVHWTIDDEFIYIGLKAPTKGWVGIGWRPGIPLEEEEEGKKGVDQYMGFVKDGKLSMLDAFQAKDKSPPTGDTELTGKIKDKDVKGKDDILEKAGSEDASGTTIEFKRKLNTQDIFDNSVPAQGEVYLAYGPDNADDFTTYHKDKRKEVIVNFVTGKVEKKHD